MPFKYRTFCAQTQTAYKICVFFSFRKKENEEKTSAKYMIMQIALQKDGVFPLYGLLFIIEAIFTHCSPACRVHPLVVLFTK